MITISLNNLGKKFNKEWIFRNISYEINPAQKLVILGGNGSGKSTLLQVISGFITPNEGEILCRSGEKNIDAEKIKDHISFASHYLQLVEDFTLTELIDHTRVYKPFVNDLSTREIAELTELPNTKDKTIKQYSSGMKQRLKLALAILADTPVCYWMNRFLISTRTLSTGTKI